uniref:G_PROTEIN_RECEP_F1_2 domain-containing protein n=1 Tax=Strongyloides venezuelensis TaxID=75913 RepID=A0A0K0FG09_STRVS
MNNCVCDRIQATKDPFYKRTRTMLQASWGFLMPLILFSWLGHESNFLLIIEVFTEYYVHYSQVSYVLFTAWLVAKNFLMVLCDFFQRYK